MARISKIICDRCGAEEEYKDRYPEGWSLLKIYTSDLTAKNKELCPDCARRAVEKPS